MRLSLQHQQPAALQWSQAARCRSAAVAPTTVQWRCRPRTSCCQQACIAAGSIAEAPSVALGSSKGTSLRASVTRSSNAAVSSSGGDVEVSTTTRSTRDVQPKASMATGVPALESLVDPASAAGFFCGIAADGGIYITAVKRVDGLRFKSSGLRVDFTSVNKAKLGILQKYLLPAHGALRARSYAGQTWNEALILSYHGRQCNQSLQLLQHCPIKGYAARLALEYLEATQERRKQIHGMLASYNMTAFNSMHDLGLPSSIRNANTAEKDISAAFIAGLFAAHGCTHVSWQGAHGYSLLRLSIDIRTLPRLLFFIHTFLGYGSLLPASERKHGEHGAYHQLVFTRRDDIKRFCALMSGGAVAVSNGVLPKTASGLPRAFGQTLKLKTLSTYFDRCGRLVNDRGRTLKCALVDRHMRTGEWVGLCQEFGGMECPDWER